MNTTRLPPIFDMQLKKVVKDLLWFLFGILLILIGSNFFNFLISETDSMPQHYFLRLPKLKPKKGDHTLLFSKWYEGDVIKQMVGIEGDKIWYDKNQCLWVNNQKIGHTKRHATDGSPLTAIKAQIIPKGFVFVYSNHEFSFDSRYQELGLVPVSSLKGWVIPLC